MSVSQLLHDLEIGNKKIAIWGAGYIGYSTMAFYAKKGIQTICYDVDRQKVSDINNAKINLPNIEYWLGFDVKPLIRSRLMYATTEWKRLISDEVAVHFVCVPTEKDAAPYDDALRDVIQKLATYKKLSKHFSPLIIVESTIAVDRVQNVLVSEFEKAGLDVKKDIYLAVAPRRDWFVSAEKSIVNIPRIVGGMTQEATDWAAKVLAFVSKTVVPASDCFHAALIKTVENTYRHVGIALANQLSLAYPDIDMTEVLKLVGTKWNIDTYHPSFGVGGYCIPLAPQYVWQGAKDPDQLTILRESIAIAEDMPRRVAEAVIRKGFKRVGILGLAYKGDLKVDILSPTKKIVPLLKKQGIVVKVHDPYYTRAEIADKCHVESFDFPNGLKDFDALLLVADHSMYKYTSFVKILENLKEDVYVLDNVGLWDKAKWREDVHYYRAGSRNWLNF